MVSRFSAISFLLSLLVLTANASAQGTGNSAVSRAGSRSGYSYQGNGDTFKAHAHKPPPGYQVAPSTEIEHGPDPDHDANIQRDPTTGANLTSFGTAYSSSNPTARGQMGDSTGNGWVAPRGN